MSGKKPGFSNDDENIMKNYYEILQVSPHAEPEVIDAAYRRLARKYHPDQWRSIDANSRMQEINEAYEILSDPHKREIYSHEFSTWFERINIGLREAEVDRAKRGQAEKSNKNTREDAERQKRENAEDTIGSPIDNHFHNKRKSMVSLYGLSIPIIILIVFISYRMSGIQQRSISILENQEIETITLSYTNTQTYHPTNPTKAIPTSTQDQMFEYKTVMIGYITDYTACIESIQAITQSPRAVSVLMDKNLFEAEFLPLINEAQSIQENMDNLKPPINYFELHNKFTGLFSHFTRGMSLFEEWSETRRDSTLIDEATSEIYLFDQELNTIGSLADFILNFDTEP